MKDKNPQWTEFVRALHYADDKGTYKVPDDERIFINSRYQVHITEINKGQLFGRIAWLSIKRLDKKAIHDWRDLQRIKNELIGKEIEAVEIYPSESRLVDTCNQYHLWCFVDGFKMPFGYETRLVKDNPSLIGQVVQRPWEDGNRPSDVTNYKCMKGD